MRFVQHPSNNDVLGAPKGWDQQGPMPCHALPITRADLDGVPCVWSFWKPDAEELAALNRGACVVLSAVGHTHPPIAVMVEAK